MERASWAVSRTSPGPAFTTGCSVRLKHIFSTLLALLLDLRGYFERGIISALLSFQVCRRKEIEWRGSVNSLFYNCSPTCPKLFQEACRCSGHSLAGYIIVNTIPSLSPHQEAQSGQKQALKKISLIKCCDTNNYAVLWRQCNLGLGVRWWVRDSHCFKIGIKEPFFFFFCNAWMSALGRFVEHSCLILFEMHGMLT